MAKEKATLTIEVKDKASKQSKSIRDAFKGIVITAGDIVNAFKSVANAAVDFARLAGESNSVRKAFTNLAVSQGQDAAAMLENMKKLSAGTISDMELMKQANQALLLGLPVDKFGDMLKIARSSAKATGQSMEFMLQSIVTGLGRGSKLMLDNLGILVDTNQAYEIHAQKLGTTADKLTEAERKTAFINEAMRIGKQNADAMGDSAITLSDQMDILSTMFLNAKESLARNLSPALGSLMRTINGIAKDLSGLSETSGISRFFSNFAVGVDAAIQGIRGFAEAVQTGFIGTFQAIKLAVTGNFTAAKEMIKLTLEDMVLANYETGQKILDNARQVQEQEMLLEEERRNALQVSEQERQRILAQSAAKQAAMDKIEKAKAAKRDAEAKKKELELQKKTNQEKLANQQATLSTIASLSQSNNRALAVIGKAAALTQIAIQTPIAISRALAAFPPPFNYAAAGAVGAAMAAQAARVSGIALAEGGIVTATTGGVPAVLGEGGRDEAVVPLDDGAPGLGTTINISVGAFMGTEEDALEFASMIDEKLFTLRQGGESVAFDEALT